MPRRRRIHQLRRNRARVPAPPSAVRRMFSGVDIPLRLSQFAQVGILAFTVWTIKYTVIPVYQKAVLEEAIAKKQIELREASAAVESFYARVRTAALGGFVNYAGPKCQGLLEPLPPLTPFGDPIPSRDKNAENPFTRDMAACLTTVAHELSSLKELRPEDRKHFLDRLVVFGEEEKVLKNQALREYNEVRARAAHDPTILPPLDESTRKLVEILSGGESPARRRQIAFDEAVRVEQQRIAAAYTDEIRRRILALQDLERK